MDFLMFNYLLIINRMKKETIERIKKLFKEKGYAFFDKGDYNLNIIGVRGEHKPDEFSDELYLIFNNKGEQILLEFPITTYPGIYWLKKPMNIGGCAILKEGQYRGVYQIGKHYSIEALVQFGGKVKVYRDNTEDENIILDESSIIEGYFGINIHPVMDKNNVTVGQDSAGCQVFKHIEDFSIFMSLVKRASSLYGNSFTYTLINKEELWKV